ncbi:MAG: restriction endonuclease subunit S [Deltaproteobacteria bacterium]|nr:restriction endonuclease subunit S [Deltaproteobacteria bacterium]
MYNYLVHTGCKPIYGDVLFSKDGTVGKTAVIDFKRDFVVASSLVIISPKHTKLDTHFLNYWLNNSLLQQEVLLQMAGAALRRISVEKVGRLPVLLPEREEQTAIATYLDRETTKIDKLAEKVEAAIARLQEYRTALITAAVTGKIDIRKAIA